MNEKPFGGKTYIAIDYVFVVVLALAPSRLNLAGSARAICYGFATAAGILTALTNTPYGLIRRIPFRVHGQADTPFVPTLLVLPWIAGALRERKARRFFFGFFAAVLTNYLLTDYTASE